MNLDFDLFISGSPNGDQRWPNNSEDMFCKQFFALETDTSNECDFFIEVRTSPEGQRCCYYSYVHRKDVFGLVNGNKRKGAYFALILRFKGIFCNTPRNIYFLMDMVYRNKIEGSIIEKTSTGESYLVESFASKNDKLREIENLFASQLAVIVNNLKPLDSSFASSQSGKIISYNLYEKDDATIMDTLRKHLKVHLLAFTNDQSGIIEGFKTQLLSKDKTPPITHEGMELKKAITGLRNETTIARTAVVMIVTTDAFLVIATQAIDSPYVVLGHPPKNAPTIEPTPSPRRVLLRPGSVRRSFSMIEEMFLWSATCSANTTNATGTYAANNVPR